MLSLGAQAVRCIKKHRTPWLSLYYSTSRKPPPTDLPKDKWNYNTSPLFSPIVKDTSQYPIVTANSLESNTLAPRSVKMLARDFIEDSLYNPNYGYFSKQATIFDSKQTLFIFSKLRDSTEFEAEVAKKYAAYEADQQLWHTPTELFKPWYGQAIAQCLVSEYLLKYFPYEDFIIYEIGAGNGTLALNILDYLRDEYPDVYERTRYTIVEISANLVELQKAKLHDVHPCVNVVHKSVFHWDKREPAPCFFMAMEVIDNFAHDVIRYDMETLEPYQGIVVVDDDGDFEMVYTRTLAHPPPISKVFRSSQLLRKIYRTLPFAANMSVEEYIPTRLLSLIRTLRNHFPPPPTPFDMYEYTLSQPPTLSRPSSDNFLPSRSTPLTAHSLSLSLGADYFSSSRRTDRRTPLDWNLSQTRLRNGENPYA
ncbi:S-adenosyl-L-methionine-dependent methyltransferase [Desarmillaria tabescens]|uniref:Protein arginine methyltransferase NDUFAF7 n=1 Tax=Armillaria tabescens TaxID=1929756 RepID=A0AA39U548_ARMTA|nr:S-adenosyl-L-methionine-dependent methyltransferase [Desarmillaria tabescens]KAK0467220.1 S-adenosyl-L-methionine-dependent methyltransferase [Desarmillaria tabescens]